MYADRERRRARVGLIGRQQVGKPLAERAGRPQ